MKVHHAQHIGIGIQCPYPKAYGFISNPANLPQWAAGLAGGIEREGGDWTITTPQGKARLRFEAENAHGVLDHTVFPAPGIEIHVPMRVVPNGDGCEVLLTLFQNSGMSDTQFEEDANLVRQDLNALKRLLESGVQ